jgi:hypothetical protein
MTVLTDEALDGVGDIDLVELLALVTLTLGLRLGYLDGSFRGLPTVGRFQYVWSPNSLSVFIFVDRSSTMSLALFLVQFGLVTAGGNNVVMTKIP